jgi:hypothetical protein
MMRKKAKYARLHLDFVLVCVRTCPRGYSRYVCYVKTLFHCIITGGEEKRNHVYRTRRGGGPTGERSSGKSRFTQDDLKQRNL